ncbi:MAG: transporter substrate-binding domain-containing protein [Clostridiales Family XIII bacterium]|jgi:putative lysine transport system substrate-binding protein|nr:transporter substrate-binding domain-containing protein [Clostridiales Family XIII bacterium]
MKKMRFISIAVIALMLALTFAACGDGNSDNTSNSSDGNTANGGSTSGEDEFRVGLECNYAPFNWTQTDETEGVVPISSGGYAGGYDVEIAKIIADGLGKKLVIVKTEWDGLIPSLQSNTIDAVIAGMSPTAERQESVNFSEPYYESTLVVVVRKDGAFASAKTLADFDGAKITGQLNTFHYTVIDQIPGAKKLTAMETFPAMIVALQSGSIDGYVSELPGAVSAQASNPDLTYIEFSAADGFKASPEDTAIAVALRKGEDGTLARVNEILNKISKEQREALMNNAVATQPIVSE